MKDAGSKLTVCVDEIAASGGAVDPAQAEALAAEREQSAAALEEERAKFSAKLEEALEAEARGVAADSPTSRRKSREQELLLEEMRQTGFSPTASPKELAARARNRKES